MDAGLEQMLKILIAREHQFWLDPGENADRWYGNKTEPFGGHGKADAFNTLGGQ